MMLGSMIAYLNASSSTENKIHLGWIRVKCKKWNHKILRLKYRLLFLSQCGDKISKHKSNWGNHKGKKIHIFGYIKIQTISIKKIKGNKNKQQYQPEKNVCNKNIKN